MKRHTFLFIVVIIFIISIFLFTFTYNFLLVDKYNLKYDFKVSSTVGFNADTDYMHFGSVPLGSNAFRSFSISNDECIVCNVKIKIIGDNKDWIKLSEYSFKIYGNQTKQVIATLDIPTEASPGEYSGEFIIYFWKDI